jgi:hypothetical protein
MSEERVTYNGVSVIATWPARIEEAQTQPTYVINGQEYERIRFGDEADDWGADRGPCHDCAVLKGQFHVGPACDVEQCPRCGGQVLSCDCEYQGDDEDEGPGE